MKKIPLTQGKMALVDDSDYDWLVELGKWHYSSLGYAHKKSSKSEGQRSLYMHRLILNPPNEKYTDHVNGNKLDNRKENLRVCDRHQNMYNMKTPSNNTSGYKGVFLSDSGKKWRSRIIFKHKKINLGTFDTPQQAALAYNKAAKVYAGVFAKLNKIGSPF